MLGEGVSKSEYEAKEAVALMALRSFHETSLLFPRNYNFTWDEFITYIRQISPDFLYFYGKTIDSIKLLSIADIMNINERLARRMEGKIPADSREIQEFITILSQEVLEPSVWFSAAVVDVIDEIKQTSSAVVKSTKYVGVLVPAILGGYVLYKIFGLFKGKEA